MTRTKIGKLVFDAGAMCSVQCIGSLHDGTKDGKEWLMKLDKPNTAAKADSELYRAFRDNLNRPIKTENVLYTRLKTMYDFEIKTNVQWPRLARISSDGPFIHEPILFPPTVVNAKITGQRTLVIENPTEWSIIVQPILLGDMENKHKIENELKKDFNFLVDLKNGQKYSDDFGIGIKQKNGNPRQIFKI
jgi:hypothetical protein